MNKFPIALYNKFITYCINNLKMTREEAKKAFKYTRINYKNEYESIINIIKKREGILGCFVWSETPEGFGYWAKIHERQ